ncbi:hypothetical protein PInf_022344 [Phytophthora infestans]|nr:hypothetical protein PInf_022344 [Phytophthora infestans]
MSHASLSSLSDGGVKDNLCKISNEWKHSDQHVARHDVYGTKFREAWELRSHDSADVDSGKIDDCESFEHILETLDDIAIED